MEGHLAGALSRWNDPISEASAHLCVLQSAEVVLTVKLENVAFHAGTDYTTGRTMFWRGININPHSIGIELEGFAATGYAKGQIIRLRRVVDWLCAKYPTIPRQHTFDQVDGLHAHSEISNMRGDPGPLFFWQSIL
jgi:N-acetyl-anhydromuramyl-L-alanine amidase AmpD